ncbi:2-dehydropantoate 2-reductase [Alteromonas sp. D210916BOD_24]|uniref:ketopantoate reductase family protein n=1 Tax=Alteromonas sp. D210916BOD_24 TaxID=3157618 RepID=UPI00399CD911
MGATIHIVGGGAIGSLLAAGAQRHGVSHCRYPRDVNAAPVKATWIDGSEFNLSPPNKTPNILNKDDVLVLPLKVYQLHDALQAWQPFLKRRATVVLLHNGMGGYEIARNVLPEDYPLLLATTSHGAIKYYDSVGISTVRYTGRGITKVGSPTNAITNAKQLKEAVALLERVLPPVEYQQDIWQALWLKLAVNAVINPITALYDIQNKQIAQPQFDELREAICHEFTLVANVSGQNFCSAHIQQEVLKVAKATGENYSSMHQDVVHGRTTEIEAINGYIVQMAKKKGIHVPVNTLLVERIKALSS